MQLFAQLDWQPLFEDHGLPLAIMGLIVVFAALTLLRVFIGLLPRILAVLDDYFPEPVEPSRQVAVAAATPDELPDKLPDEMLAVIAAAVAATIRKPHRVLHTRALTSEELRWSLEGRLQQHASHRIQPRDPR